MRICAITFYGSGEERDARLGLPVPFYRYLIFASELPGYSVASVTGLFGHGPMPDQVHYPVTTGGVEAAVNAAVAALSNLPNLKGLEVRQDDEGHHLGDDGSRRGGVMRHAR